MAMVHYKLFRPQRRFHVCSAERRSEWKAGYSVEIGAKSEYPLQVLKPLPE
jgi:hypothetical protein